ncbi:MAG TPA: hypothetical protein VJH68_05735 [Candidatus Nanoarchaeia archaeon]|nr:hypothetical protein [Candidatus Nanoarchaeia archaeon]
MALLSRAAGEYVGGRKKFSKEEIVKRINEIKYLSSQKKVPKLTLRKEIIHLESKLRQVFELEKELLQQEKKESAKIILLKDEIGLLKKRIALSEDKDLQKKVDTLSNLLGESLAKQTIIEEIAVARKASDEHKQVVRQNKQRTEFVSSLLERLQGIKQELSRKGDLSQPVLQKITEKIKRIEERLQAKISGSQPAAPAITEEKSRHTLIFHAPSPRPVEIDEAALERELPLPPPPRMATE